MAFDGAFQAPDASALNVHFGGSGGSQDLQTIRIGGKFYQRAAGGGWQESTGAGPIISTLSQIDPQRLCDQSLAQVDTSKVKPVEDTINGVKTLHYVFGPAELAGSPGIFGRGRGDQQGAAPDTHLDVWTVAASGYPMRIVLNSSFSESGGASPSTLSVSMDIGDFNGSDISIRAPL